MPIASLLPLLLQVLAAMPEVIDGVQQIWSVATSKEPPTHEQQTEYDRALEEAHRALQNS
jgi:hypothetical protein